MKDIEKLVPWSYPNDKLGFLCKDYMIVCDEYPGVYQFMSFLENLYACDYSESPQDWFSMKDGMIQSHWIIFVSCLPKDMEKLKYIADRSEKYDISIIEDDDLDDMIPFI